MTRIIVGITADTGETGYTLARTYTQIVSDLRAVPIILPHDVAAIETYLAVCDAFVFTGGDDPTMEPFGCATHPKAKPIDAGRQEFEVALLQALKALHDVPVLGVCLGMQLMGLVHGGRLDQHLPDALPTHEQHWGKKDHAVSGLLGEGIIQSHHRQALTDPGNLEVAAVSDDGVIEAVHDPGRAFYLGVQWHPERTADESLGRDLFARLVNAVKQKCAR